MQTIKFLTRIVFLIRGLSYTKLFLLVMEPSLVFERQPSEGCSKHPGESIQTYCNTCNELLCSRCLMRGHDNHKISSYSDYLMHRLKQAEKHLHRLASIEQRAENLKSRLRSYGNEFEKCYGDSLKTLNNFEKVRVGMEAWKENVTAELERKKTIQLQRIDEVIDSNGDLEGLIIKLPKVAFHKLFKETLPLKVKELTPNSVIALKNTYYHVRRYNSSHYDRSSIASNQSDILTITSLCESSRSTSSCTDRDEDSDSMSSYFTALDGPHRLESKFKDVPLEETESYETIGFNTNELLLQPGHGDDHTLSSSHFVSQTSQVAIGHPNHQEKKDSSIQTQSSSINLQQFDSHEDISPPLSSGHPNQQERKLSSLQFQSLSSNPQQWEDHKDIPPPLPSGHSNQQERKFSSLQSQSHGSKDSTRQQRPFPLYVNVTTEDKESTSLTMPSLESQSLSSDQQQWEDPKNIPPPLPSGHPNQQERKLSSLQSQSLSSNPQQWDNHKNIPPPLPSGHPSQQERKFSSLQSQSHGSKDSTRQKRPFPLYETRDKKFTPLRIRSNSAYSHLHYFHMEHSPPLQRGHHPIQKTKSAPFFSKPSSSIIPAVSPIKEQLPSSPGPYLLPYPSTSGSIESRMLNTSDKDIVPPHCDYDTLESVSQAAHMKSDLSLEEPENISTNEVVYDNPLTLTASQNTNQASQPTPYQPLYSANKVQPYHLLNVTSQFSATAMTSTMDTYASHLINDRQCKETIIRPSNIIVNSCLAENSGEYVSLYDVCVYPDGSMVFSDPKNLCLRILLGTTESSKRITKRFKNNIHGQPQAIAYDKFDQRILVASDDCLTQVEYSEELKKFKSRKLIKGFTPLSITCTMTGGSSSLYVTVWPKVGEPCIHHLDHNGQFLSKLLSSDVAKKPQGIDYKKGYLVVSTLDDGCLIKISPSGNPLWESNVDARTPGILQQPFGVAILPNEYIAVTECSAHRVSVFSKDGRLVLRFGELGSDPGKFKTPQGIAVRLNKELLVIDSGNDRIQIFLLDSLELPQSLCVEFD